MAVGGFLVGGAISLWKTSRPLAGSLGACAALAVAAGALRLVAG